MTTDVFIPRGYVAKSFWANDSSKQEIKDELDIGSMVEIQPFSAYQQDNPHVMRKKGTHLGAMPRCRASAAESLDLVRKVLQPSINHDIAEVFERYYSIFQDAAQNIGANMESEPFSSFATEEELDPGDMVYKLCCDSLDHCKTLFAQSKPGKPNQNVDAVKAQAGSPAAKSSPLVASSLPNRLMMKRVPSPDFPWSKRLGKRSPRRSLSPTPRPKRSRGAPNRRYGSPLGREPLSRENWNPDRLTEETQFIMGTKANKALGLGATRGRIYMKHPELFKYSSDPEDKKWMVKNNCMMATGGKNTFILIADDIYDLLDNEYKDSPHIIREEMQVFKLPEFILQKMRSLMLKEKKLAQKLTSKPVQTQPSRAEVQVRSEHCLGSDPKAAYGTQLKHQSKRSAAEKAAAVIVATSQDMNENSNERNTYLEPSDPESSSREDVSASDYDGDEGSTSKD